MSSSAFSDPHDHASSTSGAYTNGLASAASAYLRSARQQPVHWHEFGEEAFARARQENKPVLLDIGAVWCHWCHVMDRESYENGATAAIINEHFVAVKVDRDERPDVDARYQAAVATISGQGGWPLTVFLTPLGVPFFGGTYFPPEDRTGRAGFPRVLLTMAGAFADKREEVDETAGSILEALEINETFPAGGGDLGEALLDRMIMSCVDQFDPRNGGFGAQPKFPHASALDLLLDAGTRPCEIAVEAARVATFSLGKMAAGGIHDQLAGGFHRYSVDERWIVPHFEKMAYDNSELLGNYVHAFQSFARPEFAQTARGIVRWMDEWLSDREHGGFYASQDADDSLEDDGDYFTWTREEARSALTPEEFQVAALHYNLRDLGDMHHNPQKNVLHVGSSIHDVARKLERDESGVRDLLQAAQVKLYAARLRRRTPYIDKTVYTGWNAMCISAYLLAARVLRLPEAGAFAIRSLDRILRSGWTEENSSGLKHVIAYDAAQSSSAVPGVLDDYAFLAKAALDAWEYTGQLRYFDSANRIATEMLARFGDEQNGGFFDTQQTPGRPQPLAVLATRRKPIQDSPTPSGNATAALILLRLHELTGEEHLKQKAEAALRCFAGVIEQLGLYAGSYALALRRLLEPPVQVCIVGDDARARELELAAHARYAVNKSILRLTLQELNTAALPPVLAKTLPQRPSMDGSFAVVCRDHACQAPVQTPEALLAALAGM